MVLSCVNVWSVDTLNLHMESDSSLSLIPFSTAPNVHSQLSGNQ